MPHPTAAPPAPGRRSPRHRTVRRRPPRALAAPLLALALGPALLLATGCERPPEERQAWNVVMVMVDTLRADHVGAYGYHRPTSPTLDDLAAEGVLFEHLWAQAPCTYPSVNSLLTSRYPVHLLGGEAEGDLGLPDGVPSLAEMLRSRGYATYAVSASPIVRASPSHHNKVGGFGGGFDDFHESCQWGHGECVNRAAFEHLDRAQREPARPFFLYLHYMDPHDPYDPPDDFPHRFAGSYDGPHEWVPRGDPNPIADMVYHDGEEVEVGEAELDHLVGLYDDEISYFDSVLHRLLGELEERGLAERTLLVVLSDHGEAFLENGHVKHCRNLYDHTLHTPLVMRVPGLDGPRRVEVAAGNLDVVPTLLDYVDERLAPRAEGEAAPLTGELQGESLRPWIEGGAAAGGEDGDAVEPRLVFASMGVFRAAMDGRFKLIHDLRTDSYELYDLEADPRETTDVTRRHRRDFRRLQRALEAWVAEQEGRGGDLERTEETQEHLRALGYL